jgi:hypothetical protein
MLLGGCALFTAYFDASGSPDEGKALVVAGYVSTADQWLEFDREWRSLLAEEDVSDFHMRDFTVSRRQFTTWKGDEVRRKRFLQRLIGIIKRRVHKSIANGVILKHYNRIDSEYMLHEYVGYPYALCGLGCMKDVHRWAEKWQHQFPECIFEDGDKHKVAFRRLIERFIDWPTPVFRPKKGIFAFQAADLTAWESLKLYTQAESGEFFKLRESFKGLERIPHDWAVYTEKELSRMCKTFNIPKRTSVELGRSFSNNQPLG